MLMNELDQAKQEILSLKANNLKKPLSRQGVSTEPDFAPTPTNRVHHIESSIPTYELKDISSKVEMDSKEVSKRKKQIQDEMVLTK